MKHICRTKHAICLLVILLLCVSMLLTSCIRIQKKSDASQSDTKPVAETEGEEEYIPDANSSGGTRTEATDNKTPVETDEDGNRIFSTLGGKTPMQMYQATQEQLMAMEKYEIRSVADFTFSMSGTITTMQITQLACKGSENAYCKTVVLDDPVESWYVDGLFYMRYYDDTGVEQKVVVSDWTQEEFLEQNDANFQTSDTWIDSSDIRIENDYFVWDGSSYLLECEVAESEAIKLLESIGMDSFGTVEQASMHYTLQFNAVGRLQTVSLSLTVTLRGEDGTMTVTANGKDEYLGIGQTVTPIKPPADADEYVYYGGK